MQTKVWGPAAWFYFHSVMHHYPDDPSEKDIIRYRQFLLSFADTLPCEECREDFSALVNNYVTHDEYFLGKRNMIEMGYELHNKVNEKIGNVYSVTSEDVVEKYSRYETRDSNIAYEMEYSVLKESDSMNNGILIVASIVIIYLFYKYV